MSDIFISYARDDRSKVEPLAKALEARGWSVWWDPRIRAGTPFDRVIEKALRKTRCVLVVWSQASVDSDWVRAEASYGLQKGFLVSIAIERGVAVPIRFLNIHTEPLLDWDEKKASAAFDKIVKDLEAIIDSPDVPFITMPPTEPPVEHPDLDSMVEVPAGEFIYQDGRAIIEKPFMIDVYPVTNQQYKNFMKAGGYQNEQLWSKKGQAWLNGDKVTKPRYWHDENLNQPEHPVVGVNYYEVESFARWAGKRLPTEKEWERAARGTDGRQYPWGNEFDKSRCNTKLKETTPVTHYSSGISPVGCYDMTGNGLEWTNSWYDYKETLRVLRGGSWDTRNEAHSAFRIGYHPILRDNFVGFRCAKTKNSPFTDGNDLPVR